jgi:hypothetical protein
VARPPRPAPRGLKGEPFKPTSPLRRLSSALLLGLLSVLLGLAAAAAVGLVAIAMFVLVRAAVG